MQDKLTPFITDDTLVMGLIAACLGFVFFTQHGKHPFWKKFYGIVPPVLMCYLLPALLRSAGVISDTTSGLYHITSQYLLPAALVLMTLSMDLKAIIQLGPKALIMFLTGSLGIVIGGPIALLVVSWIDPSLTQGVGFDALWRGLSTIAGSWIGGGANQAAMFEVFQYNPEKYGGMVLVDIVVANIWLAVLLLGVGRKDQINRWLKADNSSIIALQEKVGKFTQSITRVPSLHDYMALLAISFVSVGIGHALGGWLSQWALSFEVVAQSTGFLSFLSSSFFWMVVVVTLLGMLYSTTSLKNYEGAGASKIGSVFVYLLVASIGMKMDLGAALEQPGLIAIGVVWMVVHAGLMIGVAKWIKAPYFFLAVGSQANVGGAASAPIIAAEFHPALSSVGVILAVFGYAVGTAGALICAYLMEIATTLT